MTARKHTTEAERKEAWAKYMRDRYRALSREEKDRILAGRRQTLSARTDEQKRDTAAKKRASHASLSADAKLVIKAKALKWREHQIANGLCVCCRDVATARLHCDHHWFVSIGQNHGIRAKDIETIKSIWDDQRGVCPLSGERLVKGVNASLDHIVPVVRGGDNSRSNLRWIIKAANFIKGDMTDADFIALCQRVARHQEKTRVVRAQEAN